MKDVSLLIEVGADGTLPTYATAQSAGMDIYSAEAVELKPLQRQLIRTGLRMVIPDGFEGQIRPRSGLALKKGIALVNSPGTIDADYRGEVGIIAINLSDSVVQLEKGERVAQLVICPVVRASVRQIPDISVYETERGAGGFGSTGTK